MRGRLRWAGALVTVGMLSGCQMAAGYLATDFGLAVEPDSVTVARGEDADVVLRVTRILPIDVSPFPVTIVLHDPPEGVSLAEGEAGVQIPSGLTEETVTLQVAADAEVAEHELVFRGDNVVKTREVRLALTVQAAAP